MWGESAGGGQPWQPRSLQVGWAVTVGAPGLRSERPQRFPGRRVFRGKRRQPGEGGEWGRGGRPAQAEAPLPAQALHIPKQAPRPTLSGPRPSTALPFFPSEVLSSPGSAGIQLPCSCSLAHAARTSGLSLRITAPSPRCAVLLKKG